MLQSKTLLLIALAGDFAAVSADEAVTTTAAVTSDKSAKRAAAAEAKYAFPKKGIQGGFAMLYKGLKCEAESGIDTSTIELGGPMRGHIIKMAFCQSFL